MTIAGKIQPLLLGVAGGDIATDIVFHGSVFLTTHTLDLNNVEQISWRLSLVL